MYFSRAVSDFDEKAAMMQLARRSMISDSHQISQDKWVLALVRKKDSEQSFLLIEGQQGRERKIFRSDLFLDPQKRSEIITALSSVDPQKSITSILWNYATSSHYTVFTQLTELKTEEANIFRGTENCIYQSWDVTIKEVELLLQYLVTKMRDCDSSKSSDASSSSLLLSHNHASWCVNVINGAFGRSLAISEYWDTFSPTVSGILQKEKEIKQTEKSERDLWLPSTRTGSARDDPKWEELLRQHILSLKQRVARPSSRWKTQSQLIVDYALTITDHGADGDCLFHAIVAQVGINIELGITGNPVIDHLVLRRATVAKLLLQRRSFEHLLNGERLNTHAGVVQIDNYDQYIELMGRAGTWGGQIEVFVLALLLERPIVLLSEDVYPQFFAEEEPGEPLFLYYTGNHYLSVTSTIYLSRGLFARIKQDFQAAAPVQTIVAGVTQGAHTLFARSSTAITSGAEVAEAATAASTLDT